MQNNAKAFWAHYASIFFCPKYWKHLFTFLKTQNKCMCFRTPLAPSQNVMGELIHPLPVKERLMTGNRWLSLISIGSLTPNTKPTSDVICRRPKVFITDSGKMRTGLFSKQKRTHAEWEQHHYLFSPFRGKTISSKWMQFFYYCFSFDLLELGVYSAQLRRRALRCALITKIVRIFATELLLWRVSNGPRVLFNAKCSSTLLANESLVRL